MPVLQSYQAISEFWLDGLWLRYSTVNQADRERIMRKINCLDELDRDCVYRRFETLRLQMRPAKDATPEQIAALLAKQESLRLDPSMGGEVSRPTDEDWELTSVLYYLAWLRYRPGKQVEYDAELLRVVYNRRPWLLQPNREPLPRHYTDDMFPTLRDKLIPITATYANAGAINSMAEALFSELYGVEVAKTDVMLPFWPPYGSGAMSGFNPNPTQRTPGTDLTAAATAAAAAAAAAAAQQPQDTQPATGGSAHSVSQSLPPDTPLMPPQTALAVAAAAVVSPPDVPAATDAAALIAFLGSPLVVSNSVWDQAAP